VIIYCKPKPPWYLHASVTLCLNDEYSQNLVGSTSVRPQVDDVGYILSSLNKMVGPGSNATAGILSDALKKIKISSKVK
jgi:hypothetical protein